DRVHGQQEIRVAHAAWSRGRPVRWCVTCATGVVQTRPSPLSLPLRAASATVAATSAASSSATMKISSALGRNRDSNTRPRYSCVIPRSRPCPPPPPTLPPPPPAPPPPPPLP